MEFLKVHKLKLITLLLALVLITQGYVVYTLYRIEQSAITTNTNTVIIGGALDGFMRATTQHSLIEYFNASQAQNQQKK